MTQTIPRGALILGIAGIIPFVWGAFTTLAPEWADWGTRTLGPRFVGPYVQLYYGAIILSFMSGVLWGFATRANGQLAAICYALSVMPALWAFFTTGGGPVAAGQSLIAGFVAILGLDWFFWVKKLAPPWWMRLRIGITVVVTACLTAGVFL